MKRSKYILDTNILIRFLTNEPKEQADAIERLFLKAAKKSLFIPDVVIVETAYVLLSFYELSKKELIEKLSVIVHYEKFDLSVSLFQKTLELYSKYPISFVDAYVGAVSRGNTEYTLCSFDKKLLSIREIKSSSP